MGIDSSESMPFLFSINFKTIQIFFGQAKSKKYDVIETRHTLKCV